MIQFQSLESELKSINERMIIRSAEIASGKKLTDEEKKEIVLNPEMAQKKHKNPKKLQNNRKARKTREFDNRRRKNKNRRRHPKTIRTKKNKSSFNKNNKR